MKTRKYTGKFWNVLLPIGLFSIAFMACANVVLDALKHSCNLSWIGWIYVATAFISSMVFKMIQVHIDKSDVQYAMVNRNE